MGRAFGIAILEHSEFLEDHAFQKYKANAVGTKILADPEKCFQEFVSEKLLILLQDRLYLKLIIVSSNFQAFLFLQDKLQESV